MKVSEGQSMIDIAMQACGSADAAKDIAELNGLSITDVPVIGRELLTPDVVSKSIASYYQSNKIQPATASSESNDDIKRVFFQELPVEFS